MHSDIILASGSPRRKMLLESAGYRVTVRASHIEEIWPGGDPMKAAIELAVQKWKAVHFEPHELSLAADTMVVLGHDVLGKPNSHDEACSILRRLSGAMHEVVTGYCIGRGAQLLTGSVCSRVWFRDLSDADILRYVNTGESMDKAGAYGMQGLGGALVDRIEGSYTNIVGLPLSQVLASIGQLA